MSSISIPELRDDDQLLVLRRTEVQAVRLPDILITYDMALRDQGKPALLLLAESLRVRTLPSMLFRSFS